MAAAARAVLREFAVTLLRMESQSQAQAAEGHRSRTEAGSRLQPPAGVSQLGAMAAAARGTAALPTKQLAPLALTLQQAWCVLQPAMRTLEALAAALAACEGRVGGALLDGLCEALARSADDGARGVALFLLERAAEPFLRMLER